MISVQSGYIQIWEAIIVVVRDGYAHTINHKIESAALCYVGKRAIAIVSVQGGRILPAARRKIFSVDQQDIGPAVTIKVRKGAAGSQRFRKVLSAGCARVMPETDTRLRGD